MSARGRAEVKLGSLSYADSLPKNARFLGLVKDSLPPHRRGVLPLRGTRTELGAVLASFLSLRL